MAAALSLLPIWRGALMFRRLDQLVVLVLGLLMALGLTGCGVSAETVREPSIGAPGPAATTIAAPAPGSPETPRADAARSGPGILMQTGSRPADGPQGGPAVPGSAEPGAEPSRADDERPDAALFRNYGVNRFIDAGDDNLPVFAIGVGAGSSSIASRSIRDGIPPDPDWVIVEDLVNYFDQAYAWPRHGDAFSINLEGAPSPFGHEGHSLLRVGLRGDNIWLEERRDATLIFAIDVSGSMAREDRLGLVRRSLEMLVPHLSPADEIGMVVYGSEGRVVLAPTSGVESEAIMEAIGALEPDSSGVGSEPSPAHVEDGLGLAYAMGSSRAREGRTARVILLSDGVDNIGGKRASLILRQVQARAEEDITLATVGFGEDGIGNALMERMARDGNGSWHHVDTLSEARRVLAENLAGSRQAIALNASVQVDFNPETVRNHRLLGYGNRAAAGSRFHDDEAASGEIRAGHSATWLYEMELHPDPEGVVATVCLSYEDPETGELRRMSKAFYHDQLRGEFRLAPATFQLTAVVAGFAEILGGGYRAGDASLSAVSSEARHVTQLLPDDGDLAEFLRMVDRAASLNKYGSIPVGGRIVR